VQLEIRRARAGDAGAYTVVASNELGEASCSSDVTVKEIKCKFVFKMFIFLNHHFASTIKLYMFLLARYER